MRKEPKDTTEAVITNPGQPGNGHLPNPDDAAPAPSNSCTGQNSGKPVSSRKIEANRKNAQKSTGPRSGAGKAKSAGNSYKHGFFAKCLFPTEQGLKDRPDYLDLVSQLHAHYQPQGIMEELWLEKFAIETLRLRRVVAYDQRVVTSHEFPFEAHSTDRVLRSETSLNRQQIVAIRELERFQADRKRDTVLDGPHEPETNDAVAEVEPATPSNPEQEEAPADKGIDESDPNFVASEGSTAPDSDGTAPIENAGTKPPADGSGQDTSPSPKTSYGLEPAESGPNLPQEHETAGTNPDGRSVTF